MPTACVWRWDEKNWPVSPKNFETDCRRSEKEYRTRKQVWDSDSNGRQEGMEEDSCLWGMIGKSA